MGMLRKVEEVWKTELMMSLNVSGICIMNDDLVMCLCDLN